MIDVTIYAAFISGLISFLSPCILPLMPGFLSYISGTNLEDSNKVQGKVFLNSVMFVLGFSLVFSLIGVLLNSILSNIAYDIQNILSKIGGLIIIIFGLYILGFFRVQFLQREYKLNVNSKFKNTYFNSFIFGLAFAIGWSPCVGVVLGSVLALAATHPGVSLILLFSYSLGLGLPFLLLGLFTKPAMKLIKRSNSFFVYFNKIVGIFLIILGLFVFTQSLNYLSSFESLFNLLNN